MGEFTKGQILERQVAVFQVIAKWRKQQQAASHFAEWYPNTAQDLKDMASGQAYAFEECANDLEKALLAGRDASPLLAVDLDRIAPPDERPLDFKTQSKKLRERCQMNIFTVAEPYPDVTKKIVRQVLSALERTEAAFVQHCQQCPQCHQAVRDLLAAPISEPPGETT